MKPILRKYYKKRPMITCENCGKRIKDDSRIIEDEDGPIIHACLEYEGEQTLQGSCQFICNRCGIYLHSLIVTVASDPWAGNMNYSERLWDNNFHSVYTVNCGYLRWHIDRFIDVAFRPKDKNNQTNNVMSWVDMHRISGFIAPRWPDMQEAQLDKLSQLYLPFVKQVRKGKIYT